MKKSHAQARVTERRKDTRTLRRYKDLSRQHRTALVTLENLKEATSKLLAEREMTMNYLASLEKQISKYKKDKEGNVIISPELKEGKVTKGGIIVPEGADIGGTPESK